MSGRNTHGYRDLRRSRIADQMPNAVERIRTVILNTAIDCDCRDRVENALKRFEALEDLRNQKRLVEDARHQRRTIAAILELLRELDELSFQDMDESVLSEAALLFDDITEAANIASRSLKLIVSNELTNDGNST